jgi:hypothetical protein
MVVALGLVRRHIALVDPNFQRHSSALPAEPRFLSYKSALLCPSSYVHGMLNQNSGHDGRIEKASK